EEAKKREEAGDLRGAAEAISLAAGWTEDKEEIAALEGKAGEWVKQAETAEAEAKIDEAVASAKRLADEERIGEAVQRLEAVRELDPPGVADHIETVLKDRLGSVEKEVRSLAEQGDSPQALSRLSEARGAFSLVREAWVEERLTALREHVEEQKRRQECDRIIEEAETMNREGQPQKALLRLQDARDLTEEGSPIDAVEERIKGEAFEKYREEAETQETGTQFQEAIGSLELAKEFAPEDRLEWIEKKLVDLQEKIEETEREEAFQRLVQESLSRVEAGEPLQAIERLKEAKAFTEDPALLDGRIEEIQEAEFRRSLEACRSSLQNLALEDALGALKTAREWGRDRDEEIAPLAAEVDALAGQLEKDQRFKILEEEATALLEGGDRRKALQVLEKAREFTPDEAGLQKRIEGVRQEERNHLLEASRDHENRGDLEEALAKTREAVEWAPEGDEEVQDRIAMLEEAIQEAEKAKSRDALLAQGEERIAAGQILEGLEALRKAVPLAADPQQAAEVLDERVEREVNQRLAEAENLAQAGQFEEALGRLREASSWDANREEEIRSQIQVFEERKASFTRRAEFRRHKAEAEKRFAAGDVRGAFEAMRIARTLAEDTTELDRRAAEMQQTTFNTYLRQAVELEGRGEIERALEACELAREWAGTRRDEVDAREKAIRDRVAEKKQEEAFRAKEEEAEQLLARGNVRRAVELLRAAISLAPFPDDVEKRIAGIVGKAFHRHMEEAARAAREGDLITAFDWLDRAREWAEGKEEDLEARIQALKAKVEVKDRIQEYERVLEDGEREIKAGRIARGVALLRRAKSLADDPEVLEERIRAVKTRTFDEKALQAVMLEEGEDFEGAILSWRDAMEWAELGEKTEEVEGFIKRLEESISEESPGEILERVGVRVKTLLQEGDIPGALRRYHVASQFVDSPEAAQKKVCEIAATSIQACVARALTAVREGDWETALGETRRGEEIRDAVKIPNDAVESASLALLRADATVQHLRLRSEATEKAERGDVKGAIEACRKAMQFTEDTEALQAVMVSLVESALERWIQAADTFEESGAWADAAKVLLNALDLFTLEEEAIQTIQDRRIEVESRLKDTQYKRYIMAAAEAEGQGELINAIEHLRRAGEFSGRPHDIQIEIDRVQALLFEQFNTDVTRVEEEEGVEGAIRFCQAALEYFPDAAVCRRKLRDLEKRWERKEKEGEISVHLSRAEKFEQQGNPKSALEAYRAAAELTRKPGEIIVKIDRLIESLIGTTFSEVKNLMKKKRFREARSLLELKAQEFPESGKIRNLLKELAEAEAADDQAEGVKSPLTTTLWDEISTTEEEDSDEGPAILTRIWETGEFRAEDLFKDLPAKEETAESELEEGAIKPLPLDETAPPEDEEDILEPIAPEPAPAPPDDIAEPPPEEMPPSPEAPPAPETVGSRSCGGNQNPCRTGFRACGGIGGGEEGKSQNGHEKDPLEEKAGCPPEGTGGGETSTRNGSPLGSRSPRRRSRKESSRFPGPPIRTRGRETPPRRTGGRRGGAEARRTGLYRSGIQARGTGSSPGGTRSEKTRTR
ncbi:MAG: coiled-coil domain-containing protein, partial [Planctomycetota bacterium]